MKAITNLRHNINSLLTAANELVDEAIKEEHRLGQQKMAKDSQATISELRAKVKELEAKVAGLTAPPCCGKCLGAGPNEKPEKKPWEPKPGMKFVFPHSTGEGCLYWQLESLEGLEGIKLGWGRRHNTDGRT